MPCPRRMIIQPQSSAPFLSPIRSIFSPSLRPRLNNKPMSPDDIIAYMLELYDLLKLQTGGNGTKNAAFLAGSSSTGSKKRKSVKDIECYNCSKKGHIKVDCWEKGGGKE